MIHLHSKQSSDLGPGCNSEKAKAAEKGIVMLLNLAMTQHKLSLQQVACLHIKSIGLYHFLSQ